MSNNLSWLGIKGLDPNASQTDRPSFVISSDSRTKSQFDDPLLSSESLQQSTPAQGPVTVRPQEPIMDMEGPPPATEEGYIPAYLRRNMGKNVRAEFIIGTNQYTDRTGRIIEVGTNYFVLEDINSRTHIMCDLYSVKFVTVLQF